MFPEHRNCAKTTCSHLYQTGPSLAKDAQGRDKVDWGAENKRIAERRPRRAADAELKARLDFKFGPYTGGR